MPKRDDLDFDYDERTNVPTFEEVSSTLAKNKNPSQKNQPNKKNKQKPNKKFNKKPNKSNNQPTKKPSKLRKIISYIILIIIILVLIGGIGKLAYDYKTQIKGYSSTVFNYIGSIFVLRSIDYTNKNRFGAEINELTISLDKEEQGIVATMTQKCEEEKSKAAMDMRERTESQCELTVNTLEDEITDLESDVSLWKNRYDDCKDDLTDCGC